MIKKIPHVVYLAMFVCAYLYVLIFHDGILTASVMVEVVSGMLVASILFVLVTSLQRQRKPHPVARTAKH